MRLLLSCLFLAVSLPAQERYRVGPPDAELIERLDLDPFYQKATLAGGFPVVASTNVADMALQEAAWLIDQLLAPRPDVRKALIDGRVRFVIYAHNEFTSDIPEYKEFEPPDFWDLRARGFGPGGDSLAVSCGEENLLRYRGDPYSTESIFLHEFAHAIHTHGLNAVDRTFQRRLRRLFTKALNEGRWVGTYAGTHINEYFAEGFQSWCDDNRENDYDHNHVNTRAELKEYDPGLAALLEKEFPDFDFRYSRPGTRKARLDHLRGYDPTVMPGFEWPARLETLRQKMKGKGMPSLKPLPLASVPELRSKEGGDQVFLLFENRTKQNLDLFWIRPDGTLRESASLQPGRRSEQFTFTGHAFLLNRKDGAPHAAYVVPKEDHLVPVR